jgi:PAS domain S-box-containing protein
VSVAGPTDEAVRASPAWQREWRWVSLALAALAALSSWGHWTWRLDQTIYDAAQSTWTRPAPDDIVIVAIDDASLAAIGRWPWKRAIHAQALDRINQAQPRSVLINLLMTEPDRDPLQDRLLADALARSGRVVLPVGHALDSLGQGHELLPIEPLRAQAHLAHADVTLDVDGVLRHAWLHAGTNADRYPHPALAVLQVGAGEPLALKALQTVPAVDFNGPIQAEAWQRSDRVAIRYLGPPGLIKQVSFAALLRGEVPDSALRGKDVLIGVTARGLADAFLTPVSGLNTGMTGVEVTAQLLSSIKHGQGLYTLSRPTQAVLAALLVWGLAWSFRRVTPRQALFNAMSLSVASVLGSWLLMWGDVWSAPFSTVMAALLAYPVWSWRRLEATARSLEAELKVLGDAAEVAAPDRRNDFMGQRTDALHVASVQLREARQLLADTLAALPDAVFVTDAEGRITQANREAAQVAGLAEAQGLIGQMLTDVLAPLTPSESPTWGLLLQRALQERAPLSTEASHPSGKQYLVNLAAAGDTATDASPGGVIACATDMTALRQAELQRQELLGFIAHDIRSPQASLIALVELQKMGAGLPPDDALAHVDMLARSTLDLCEELLQVMRAETRPVTLKEVDAYSLAEECMEELGLQARTRRIHIQGNWSGDQRLPVEVDDYLVHRALVNLLGNAVKFSPDGGAVKVDVVRHTDALLIAVQDEGPGIPENELGRLFRRYERVEQGRPSKLAAGIGLGLVFIETVARRHGGRIQVSSTPGEGSRFELWLPQAS